MPLNQEIKPDKPYVAATESRSLQKYNDWRVNSIRRIICINNQDRVLIWGPVDWLIDFYVISINQSQSVHIYLSWPVDCGIHILLGRDVESLSSKEGLYNSKNSDGTAPCNTLSLGRPNTSTS